MDDKLVIADLSKAFKYLYEDPIIGLTRARIAIETMVKVISKEKSSIVGRNTLDDMIKNLKTKNVIPGSIAIELDHIRHCGNSGAHSGQTNESFGDVSPCIASLKKVADWFFSSYRQSIVPEILINAGVVKWEPRKATLQDIDEWGWKPEDIVRSLIELDYETMKGISETNVGTDNQWLPIYQMYPDLWTLLVDGPRSVAGYLHYLALSEHDFDLAVKGKMHDNLISLDMIIFPMLPGEYDFYFSCISILKKHRDYRNFILLFDSFIQKLDELSQTGIFARNICANAFTNEGISLCRSVGMKYICEHEDSGKVFLLEMNHLPNLKLLKHHPKLMEKYILNFVDRI